MPRSHVSGQFIVHSGAPRADSASRASDDRRRKIDEVVELIVARYKVVVGEFIRKIPSGPIRFFLSFGPRAIRWLMRRPLRNALIKQFGDATRP
jgi:hypothetical protein